MSTKQRKYSKYVLYVVFLSKNVQTCLFTRFPVFSPFSAHFYPPLHHNAMVKGPYPESKSENRYTIRCLAIRNQPEDIQHLASFPGFFPCGAWEYG